jgi:hypothetical protein
MTLADRRLQTRFEFIGEQWGSLQAMESLRLHNVSREGVLVESATPLPIGSIHAIQVEHRSGTAQCYAAVRRLSPGDEAVNGQTYLIGLEFVDLDDRATALVERLLTQWPDPLGPLEA